MANILDPMDFKQILTLHLDGYSNRQIAVTLGISRNTINSYINRVRAGNYCVKELVQQTPAQLSEMFPHTSTVDSNRQDKLLQYFDQINLARNHPGFTFQYHYQQYVSLVDTPYSYTQFLEHYHRKHSKIKGSMKLEHEPGKEMFVDYAGKKLKIVDKATGEEMAVEVFVCILPNSHYTYVEACVSQKKEDFIKCCENALHFYQGVPKAIVCDNLKSAVSRASKYEPRINRSFKDFAHHYGCVVNPTRTYAPQDKALVENAVNLVYQRIYYPMREMNFFTLEDLNKEIKTLLTAYNKLLFQRKDASRLELFRTVEKEYLKELPTEGFEMTEYCRAKVQKIGYVYFSADKSYYSVPYRFIGKNTIIQYTANHVEVYYNHERIAHHKRLCSKGVYNTNPDHLSSTHKAYRDWSPQYFLNKALPYGEHVVACVEQILQDSEYPEVGYKRIMGLLLLSKSYGSERLNRACYWAIKYDMVSFNRIRNILKNNVDKTSFYYTDLEREESHIPEHENIRGASAYN